MIAIPYEKTTPIIMGVSSIAHYNSSDDFSSVFSLWLDRRYQIWFYCIPLKIIRLWKPQYTHDIPSDSRRWLHIVSEGDL